MKTNQVMFVTGAASGIGAYIAQQLYKRGQRLVVADIDEAGLKTLTQNWDNNRFFVQILDVSDATQWDNALFKTIHQFKQIDALFNIAGVCQPVQIHEADHWQINAQIDINLKGTIFGTQTFGKQMVKQGYGHIINIASIAGIVPAYGFSLYNASKFGVRGFSLASAYELREHNVYVSVVCPDIVETNMLKSMSKNPAAAIAFGNGRALQVEEIGEAILKNALEKKCLETVCTVGIRGFLVKLGAFFPSLGLSTLAKKIRQKGRKIQEKM